MGSLAGTNAATHGIQYTAASRRDRRSLWNKLDDPPEPLTGRRESADPVAGDDG